MPVSFKKSVSFCAIICYHFIFFEKICQAGVFFVEIFCCFVWRYLWVFMSKISRLLFGILIFIFIPACTHIGGGVPEEFVVESPECTLLAVGDINLGRKAGKTILGGDIDFAFEKVSDIICGADIAFANLESTISDQNGVTRRVWTRPFAKNRLLSSNASPNPTRQQIASDIAARARVWSMMVETSAEKTSRE